MMSVTTCRITQSTLIKRQQHGYSLLYITYAVLFVFILLAGVMPKKASLCKKATSCMTIEACIKKHSSNRIMSIPFPCAKGKVCCPPQRAGEEPDLPSIKDHKNYHLLPQPPQACGWTFAGNRITEGEEATPGQFPWMALVGIRNDHDGKLTWGCVGSLINSRYVLTAAHCVSSCNRRINIIRLREHNLDTEVDCNKGICVKDPPIDIRIEKIISHHNWNNSVKTSLKNDIALLRLSREVKDRNVVPICLPVAPEVLPNSNQYETAGWGSTDFDILLINPVLLKATIKKVPLEECNVCKAGTADYCPITRTQICAQGTKGVDVCKGDSGSPLMSTGSVETYQLGITSFKSILKCGEDGIPSIFTNVSAFVPWILDNIEP